MSAAALVSLLVLVSLGHLSSSSSESAVLRARHLDSGIFARSSEKTRQRRTRAIDIIASRANFSVPPAIAPRPSPAGPLQLGICLAVSNYPDLREWTVYQARVLNVDRIYVFDFRSVPPLASQLSGLLVADGGPVVYHFIANGTYTRGHGTGKFLHDQHYAYDTCIERYSVLHRWLGFLDADEFVVLRGAHAGRPLVEFLDGRLHSSAGVALNWYQVGSSDHARRPAGGVLANYQKCFRNHEVKSFCQTRHLNKSGVWDTRRSFHSCWLKAGHHTRDVFGHRVVKGASWNAASRLDSAPAAIYHYSIQSLEDFRAKQARGTGRNQGPKKGYHTSDKYFREVNGKIERYGLVCDELTKTWNATFNFQ